MATPTDTATVRGPVRDAAVLMVRHAASTDIPGILALHDRCSPRSRRARYFTDLVPTVRALERLLCKEKGHSLVVEDVVLGRIVAMGNLMWDGDRAEVAVLVEDARQRQGIGTVLLHELTALGARSGAAQLYAIVQASNVAARAALRRAGGHASRTEDGYITYELSRRDLLSHPAA